MPSSRMRYGFDGLAAQVARVLAADSGSQTSGSKFAARRDASTPASILSAFTSAWAMALTCVGWPRSPSRHAAQASAGPPWHCRSPRRRLRPPCAACAQSPRGLLETISTRPAGGAGRFPDYHLRERAVDFHADHASHQVLLFGVAEQEQWATRQLRIRARGETGAVAPERSRWRLRARVQGHVPERVAS